MSEARWRARSTVLLLTAVPALTVSTLTLAPTGASAQGGDMNRQEQFAAASAEFGVPEPVLTAVSYAQTRWDDHGGSHSTDGGYGPMHLIDARVLSSTSGKDATVSVTVPSHLDSLGRGADLIGASRDQVAKDSGTNVRAGAALLAAEQRRLGLPTGASSDPAQWYAAVASLSGGATQDSAATRADDTFTIMATGAARTTNDGQKLVLAAHTVTPDKSQLARLGLAKPRRDPRLECPRSIACQWVPSPYVKTGPDDGDYGNHDLADRTAYGDDRGPAVTHIVIHNTEVDWETTLKLVQDPKYVSWHYSLRSSDGLVAQHVPTKDVAWHAGNWYVNGHSIGLEHEGYATQGAKWFSEPMYRSSARLVKYLSTKYDVPLDRGHIIGHDQVPGVGPTYVKGMHWDPGPYWDWEHYFTLLGAPLTARHGRPSEDIVRVLPGFDENQPPVTNCAIAPASTPGVPCPTQGANFVYLRQSPSLDAPLVKDVGIDPARAASTTEASDIGARAAAGVDYVVAGYQDDWVAVWFNGEKGWIHNPEDQPVLRTMPGSFVTPKAGLAKAEIYGRAYPEAAAYASHPGVPVQGLLPLQYTFAAGQRYAVQQAYVQPDYYLAKTYAWETPGDHIDIVGEDHYHQISFGHRVAFVRAAEVDLVRAR